MDLKGPRVLYLHSLWEAPKHGRRANELIKVYGSGRVASPDLKTGKALYLFRICFGIFAIGLLISSILSVVFWNMLGALLLMVTLFVVGVVTYILASRAVMAYAVSRAVGIAEREFERFRPNVIVASTFGAVVALNMNVPPVSLVLLAPAQDVYCKYMRIKTLPSLEIYPYAIVVHPSSDTTVSLEDSIRLVETSNWGHCRLEVIDDTHPMLTLCDGDFKEFVDSAYSEGRKIVKQMKRESDPQVESRAVKGKEIPKREVDPTLFDLGTEKSFERYRDTVKDKVGALEARLTEANVQVDANGHVIVPDVNSDESGSDSSQKKNKKKSRSKNPDSVFTVDV